LIDFRKDEKREEMSRAPSKGSSTARSIPSKSPDSRELGFVFLLFLGVALLSLFFCSSHSPFYRFTAFPDANAYMGVARAMRHGLMPYRDVFDHKGLLLYLIYYLAAVLFPKSATGIYLISSVSLAVFLIYGYRIARMLLPKIPSLIATFPLVLVSAGNQIFYHGGGSTEEYLMPGLMACLYYLIRFCLYVDQREFMTKRRFFLESVGTGIFCGAMIWIKYVTLPAIAASFLIVYAVLIVRKRKEEAVQSVLGVFFGGLLVSIPCLFFLWRNDLFGEMWSAYIMFNYSYTGGDVAVSHGIANIKNLYYGIPLFIASVIGLIDLRRRTQIMREIGIVCLFIYMSVCFLFVIAFGRYYTYYFLTFAPFTICATIAIVHYIITHRKSRIYATFSKGTKTIFMAFVPALTIFLTVSFSMPTWATGAVISPKTETEYCADAVNEYWDRYGDARPPSIFCFATMDTGIFELCGTYPQVRYFYRPNADRENADRILKEQIRYIEEGMVDVVFACGKYDFTSFFFEKNPSFQLIYSLPSSEHPGDIYYVFAKSEFEKSQ
jgi:hypothetical protein